MSGVSESKGTETANKTKVEVKCPLNLANCGDSFSSARDRAVTVWGRNGKSETMEVDQEAATTLVSEHTCSRTSVQQRRGVGYGKNEGQMNTNPLQLLGNAPNILVLPTVGKQIQLHVKRGV